MDQTKRRYGPTPKPADKLRVHAVSCRLTDAELKLLDERRGKVSRGEWLRLAALSKPPRIVPEVNKAAWTNLARAAANLNQLMRAFNDGRLSRADGSSLSSMAVSELRATLDEVRSRLIGAEKGGRDEGES